MSTSAQFLEAIEALKRDPTRPVTLAVDAELTVELRAVEATPGPRKSAADAFLEIGRWEGESGEQLEELFARRQRSNRRVDELK